VTSPARRLDGLVEIAKVVSGAEAFEDVLRLTAAAARDALDAASLSLSVWERDRGRVSVLLNVGDLGPGEVTQPTDETYTVDDYAVVVPLLEEAQPYLQTLHDDPSSPGYDPSVAELLRQLGKGSCMGVPVLLEGRVWGELFATRYVEDPPYSVADIDYAQAVAGQIAAGLAQVQHLERVSRLAYTDPLTGLANRRAIDDRLDTALARHRADQRTVSLIVVDVNGLKRTGGTTQATARWSTSQVCSRPPQGSRRARWPGAPVETSSASCSRAPTRGWRPTSPRTCAGVPPPASTRASLVASRPPGIRSGRWTRRRACSALPTPRRCGPSAAVPVGRWWPDADFRTTPPSGSPTCARPPGTTAGACGHG
jgi:GAF domain-containing protein